MAAVLHGADCAAGNGTAGASERRNADLRALGGMDHAAHVPRPWNMSRFLGVLGQEPFRTRLHEVFDRLVQRRGPAVPTLGEQTAGEATHLSARWRGPASAMWSMTRPGRSIATT